MKVKYIVPVICAAGAIALSSCGVAPHRIDTAGNEGLTTINQINYKDWQIAATKCISSLLASGVLDRTDGRKTIVMVSTVKNRTFLHIDTNILTDQIRQAILTSGKAVTTTAVGGNGPDDKATAQVRELSDNPMFNQQTVQQNGTVIAPDMSLAGEIIQQNASLGRKNQSFFFFHMTLTDLKTGLAVWEDNVSIAKQDEKPLIGF